MEAVDLALDAAQAQLAAAGWPLLSVRLLVLFVAVYTFPGLLMAALTAGPRRRRRAKQEEGDGSWVEAVRLTNRAIASTAMYVVPFVLLVRNLSVWTPWAGGRWCSPLDQLQVTLLHMQLMYYVMDTPYTLSKGDLEQIVHHAIGFGMALPTVKLGECGLPMCAILFSEQGSSIWVRYSKLLRYFQPKFCAAERVLVTLNFYQNFYIMCFFVNVPLLLRISHEILLGDGFPIYGVAKYVLGSALLLQLVYDLYWNTRLWRSWQRYKKDVKEHVKSGKAQGKKAR